MVTESNSTRWYREPMMLLVVGLPLVAVIGSVITLFIAARSFDGLVADDYYKQGLEINRRLERDKRADALGLRISLQRLADDELMRIVIRGEPAYVPPQSVEVAFTHATRAGLDSVLLAPLHADGSYAFPNPELAPGRWNITVSTPTWRRTETLFVTMPKTGTNAN